MQMINELEVIFENNKSQEKKEKMEKYLLNQFSFLGIPSSIRVGLEKDFIKENKRKDEMEILKIICELHHKDEREYMYTGQKLGVVSYKKFSYNSIQKLIELTLISSWWENTDGYIMIIRRWLKENDDYTERLINDYYQHENKWIRRMTILCQLGLKDKFNCMLLEKVINWNINDQEFFIQKAIGWILRDYSKFNQGFVEVFVERNVDTLSKLAQKEGSKYL